MSSASEFKLKYLKIPPTLPINYMYKILFTVIAFFLCDKILKNFNILEDIKTFDPNFLTNVFHIRTHVDHRSTLQKAFILIIQMNTLHQL